MKIIKSSFQSYPTISTFIIINLKGFSREVNIFPLAYKKILDCRLYLRPVFHCNFLFFLLNQKEPKNQEKSKLPRSRPATRPADFSGQRSFERYYFVVRQFFNLATRNGPSFFKGRWGKASM